MADACTRHNEASDRRSATAADGMLTPALIAARLAAYRPAGMRGDHLLNGDAAPPPPWRPAAVLLPLLLHGGEISVVFTLRTTHLHAHAGQVSFPGGGAETQDADAIATALRETQEEIGLDPARVGILGTLDRYVTRSGYQVTPIVGLIDADRDGLPDWQPDEFEVAKIFSVPLAHIVTPGMLCETELSREGLVRRCYAIDWEDHAIWGATAGMLRNLVDVVAP